VKEILGRLRRWLPPISAISFLGVMELVGTLSHVSSWENVAALTASGGLGLVALSLRELHRSRALAAARVACGIGCFAAAAAVGAYGAGSWTWLWTVTGVAAAVAAGWALPRVAEFLLPEGRSPAALQLRPPPPAEPWQNLPRL
jgi:hypothetical protein